MTGLTDETIINIADEFSDFPVGRDMDKHPFSGEKFREELLVPPLRRNERVVVNFEGVFACPPSFLDEAFGGLVRRYGRDKEFLDRINCKLDFRVTNHPKYDGFNRLARDYIQKALNETN